MKIAILTIDNREHFKHYELPVPYFGTAPQALLEGFALLPEHEFHVFSCTQQPMVSPPKLAPNIFFHSLHVPKIGWMRTGYQGCIRATRKKLRELKPDLVHGQGTERDCAISAVFSGYPNILTIHGNLRRIAKVLKAKPFSFNWLAAQLESFTIPRSNGVVCITHHTQREVAELAKKTWIVPNAVDGSFFEIEAQPSPQSPPRLLCVGHVYALKNQVGLIKALDPLAEKHKFTVIFFGAANPEEPYAAEFLRLVKSRPWCAHHGFADRDTLKKALRDATLLVHPSFEDNCPMAVLEAMAAGVPVLASKVGGIPDLIEEGKTGFFCDPSDVNGISATIEKLLLNPSQLRNIAQQAKLRAKQRFHPRVVAERHIEIYSEIVNKK